MDSAATQVPPPEARPKRELWPSLGLGPHFAAVAMLGAITLFAFVNTLHNTGFALDNKFIILEDPRLQSRKAENVKLIFTQDYWWPKAVSGLYRPLTTFSYFLNYTIFGNATNATGYHWINFLLHWANAVLAYFAVLVLMEKFWPALFAAAIFAVHPIVTESVTNIVGRADLFALGAVLSGFLCYVKSTLARGWWRALWILLLMVITTLGMFCKESAVVVLGVMFLYDLTYRFHRRHPNALVSVAKNAWEFFGKGYIWLALPLVGLMVVRAAVFGQLRPPELPFVDNPLIDADFWTARLTAIKVIGKYLWLLVWPQTLSCDYSYNQVPMVNWAFKTWEDWQALVAVVVIVALLVIAVRNYRRNKAVFFFILFFFGTLLPSSNLIPNPTFGSQSIFDKVSWCIGSIMAERFLYIPSLGFAGCVVIFVYALCRKLVAHLDISGWAQRVWLQTVARSLLAVLVILFGVRTFLRNSDWEDDIRLWTQAAIACPDSFKSHKSLAFALYEKDADGKNIDRIIEEGEKAAAITDRAQIVFLHLGAYYRIKGDLLAQRAADGSLLPTPESQKFYAKSVEALERAKPLDRAFNEDNRKKELARGRRPEAIMDIGNHEIYWNLGLSHMRLGQHQQAFDAYLYMRHLAPGNADAYLSLASVFLAQSKAEEAAVTLLQALLLDNNRQEALRLLIGLYRQIDREGCSLAMTPGQTQPRLNADCALVRKHICSAYYGLVQVFLETRQYNLAKQTKQNALSAYACPREPFDQLLPETSAPSIVRP
jgi:tetratricopeptide (TPR) repeat protein